ncbi:unnamed protein product [Caenorhabditis angaria]|uniref:Uncharacterized protein n=1 Tax=Caenorhabditis angaria TaxID=860376 RepID=A0A9P1N3M6_9PELO|nr:unnamed protein product [Caenorhabditis angaria]
MLKLLPMFQQNQLYLIANTIKQIIPRMWYSYDNRTINEFKNSNSTFSFNPDADGHSSTKIAENSSTEFGNTTVTMQMTGREHQVENQSTKKVIKAKLSKTI